MQKSYPVLKMLIPITLLLVLGLQACGDKDTDNNSIPPPIPPDPINLTKDQLNELSTKRRYSRLNQLPIDRTNDDVWDKLPLPILN